MRCPDSAAIVASMAIHGSSFAATRWSVVARSGGEGVEARAALSWLCEAYWDPLLRFARRGGLDHHDAQDAVQAFFAHLIERGVAAQADPAKGRFRTFLLAVFACQLGHARERAGALKRGGGNNRVVIDPEAGIDPPAPPGADPDFDRDWARTLLARALARLEADQETPRQTAVFAALKRFLSSDGDAAAYAAAGAGVGLGEGAAKVAVHRLRVRFRAALRSEVAETIADADRPGAIDAELADLFQALAGG